MSEHKQDGGETVGLVISPQHQLQLDALMREQKRLTIQRSEAALGGVFFQLSKLKNAVRGVEMAQSRENMARLQADAPALDGILTRFEHGFNRQAPDILDTIDLGDITRRSGLTAPAGASAPYLLFDAAYYAAQAGLDAKTTDAAKALAHYLLLGDLQRLDPHPAFSVDWYYRQNFDALRETGLTALQHFVLVGGATGASPHPLFDVPYYLGQVVGHDGRNPLVHYLEDGWRHGYDPHPLFNTDWINSRYLKPNKIEQCPLTYFLLAPAEDELDPHPVFSTRWFTDAYPEVTALSQTAIEYYLSGYSEIPLEPSPIFNSRHYIEIVGDTWIKDRSPLQDYVQFGLWNGIPAASNFTAADILSMMHIMESEPLNFSPLTERAYRLTRVEPISAPLTDRQTYELHQLFDDEYYTQQISLADSSPEAALEHYLDVGWRLGLKPNSLFDTFFYLETHADVLASGLNPLLHFIQYGGREGRASHPLFDGAYYLKHNKDVDASGVNPLVHFLMTGGREGRNPSAKFDAAAYMAANRDVEASGINPLIHWIEFGEKEGRPRGVAKPPSSASKPRKATSKAKKK